MPWIKTSLNSRSHRIACPFDTTLTASLALLVPLFTIPLPSPPLRHLTGKGVMWKSDLHELLEKRLAQGRAVNARLEQNASVRAAFVEHSAYHALFQQQISFLQIHEKKVLLEYISTLNCKKLAHVQREKRGQVSREERRHYMTSFRSPINTAS